MDFQALGRVLIVVGVLIAAAGALLLFMSRFAGLERLPGNLRFEAQGFTCLVPIASMIVLSILLTIILNVIIRLINRP